MEAITPYSVDTYATSTNTSPGDFRVCQNLTLTGKARRGYGNTKDNTIVGNDSNNTLNGLAGADTLIGKSGNDTYVIDNEGDIIVEIESEGTIRFNQVSAIL